LPLPTTAVEGESPRAQKWECVADTFKGFGIPLRGPQIEFLSFTANKKQREKAEVTQKTSLILCEEE
jgi:hypothetical protein